MEKETIINQMEKETIVSQMEKETIESQMEKETIVKIVSEYDQEIPQSQTADNPMAPKGRATQPSWDIRTTNEAKQPALSSPSR